MNTEAAAPQRLFRPTAWALLLVLLLSCTAAVAGQPAATRALQPGDLPPADLGTTMNGERVRLDGESGAVTVVSFWAGWCAPCRQEMSLLDQIQAQVGADQLRVIAVNIEDRSTFRRIHRQLRGHIHFTLSNDPRGVVARKYGVNAIPHSVYIGRDGRVDEVHLGFSEAQVDKVIRELNRLLAVPLPSTAASAGAASE